MIKSLKIEGLGPFVTQEFQFSNQGATLAGPNEVGKSTVKRAVCWCLTGMDETGEKLGPEHIHRNPETGLVQCMRVEIVTFGGRLVGRSMDQKGTVRRYIKAKDDLQSRTIGKEEDFGKELQIPDRDLALAIMAPMYALRVLGRGNAEGLLALLHRLLPGVGSYEAEVEGFLKKKGYTSHPKIKSEKDAEEHRKAAKIVAEAMKARFVMLQDEQVELAKALNEHKERDPLREPVDALWRHRRELVDIIEELAGNTQSEWHYVAKREPWLTASKNEFEQLLSDLIVQAAAQSGRMIAEGRLEQLDKESGQAKADALKAAKDVEEAEAFVQAHKIAPARLAQARIDALGALPNCRVLFLEEPKRGEPLVKVEYDGLPSELASDGSEIWVDLHFRMALRDAAGLLFLPIFVDRLESLSLQRLPEIRGQRFLLRHDQQLAGLVIGSADAYGDACRAVYDRIIAALGSLGAGQLVDDAKAAARDQLGRRSLHALYDTLRFVQEEK